MRLRNRSGAPGGRVTGVRPGRGPTRPDAGTAGGAPAGRIPAPGRPESR